jgi:predicted transcriptional regulator of viral defense system
MARPNYLQEIKNRITSATEGEVFITADFLDIADTQAVNKALSRLTSEGIIRRIMRGIYDRPKYSQLLKEYTVPHMEAIAKALARNHGWTIVPCGDTALNMLGLSTQVPAVWLYVSDGPYKTYEIGNLMLKFNHTSNKDITGMSYKSVLVIQALKALGSANVDIKTVKRLSNGLSAEEKAVLLLEAQYSTAWIYEIIKKVCKEEDRA